MSNRMNCSKIWRTVRKSTTFVSLFAAVCLSGCSEVTVRQNKVTDLFQAFRASAGENGELSMRTWQTLRQFDLDQVYRRRPAEAFAELQRMAEQEPQPDYLFALAEISYLFAQHAEKWAEPSATAYYYLCAGYAYHYLFPVQDSSAADPPQRPATLTQAPLLLPSGLREIQTGPSDFDPRFRLACDFYNRSLARCISSAQRVGRLDPCSRLQLPTADDRGFTLSVVHHGFPWRPEEFGTLLFCSDFEVAGLTNHYKGYGLGVPMIGTRQASAPAPANAHYPKDVNFPVSAFFRFEGSLAQLRTQRAGRLELYNPLELQTVSIHGKAVPLETDLTTPLAYCLANTDLDGIEYQGFLKADKIRRRAGIYMFEPYQPGKIPVVMVHGVLSSPLIWASMFNDLRADPELRKRYQFWFYLYPTADPFLASVADLRQRLANLRKECDPYQTDTALDQMVFVGHSMGGLVSKLLTIDSGDDFWRLVSNEPLQNLKLKAESRSELQNVFYFERQPSVKRVVFLATPHHGSKVTPSAPGWLLKKFIGQSKQLLHAANDLVMENPQAGSVWKDGTVPTSFDLLAPNAPALELLAARPRADDVHYHSIIGVSPRTNQILDLILAGVSGGEEGDAVVPYKSAHIEGVESEIVLNADHFHIHHNPRAVLEVRRILFEHLAGKLLRDLFLVHNRYGF